MKKRNNKKGFTIVELVIVIAVIAILAAVLIPTFSGVIEKARESANLQECKNTWTEYLASLDADGFGELPTENTIVKYGDLEFIVNGASFVGLNKSETEPTMEIKYSETSGWSFEEIGD